MTLAFHTSVTSKTVLDVIFFNLKLVLIDAIELYIFICLFLVEARISRFPVKGALKNA